MTSTVSDVMDEEAAAEEMRETREKRKAVDACLLAAVDELDARIDKVLTAPGLPWTTREVSEVMRGFLAMLRDRLPPDYGKGV